MMNAQSRTYSITTQSAHGGKSCPARPETRSCEMPITSTAYPASFQPTAQPEAIRETLVIDWDYVIPRQSGLMSPKCHLCIVK